MKEEKFKVLLYLKKSTSDKSGKTPIMGRITVGKSMSQFSCKISCTPDLWNPRESRLNGKNREAVATNAKLDKLLLSINEAYNTLLERKQHFIGPYQNVSPNSKTSSKSIETMLKSGRWAKMCRITSEPFNRKSPLTNKFDSDNLKLKG